MTKNTLLLISILVLIDCFSWDKKEALAVNSVLDINKTFPYLINKTSRQVVEPRDYMNFDIIYTPTDEDKRQLTAQSRNYLLIKAFDFANYYQSDYWHYSSEEDLRLSAQPVADEAECARQLDWLNRQLNKSDILFKKGQQHINLMTFMDSFGKPMSDTFLGRNQWLGSYYECTNSKFSIDIKTFEMEECRSGTSKCKDDNPQEMSPSHQNKTLARINGRYCIGKVRDKEWPNEKEDDYVPQISYKVGLCLPEVCETLTINQHRNQIQRLMLYGIPEYLKSRIYLSDMYCLPDERSPIRELQLPALIFLTICSLWLLMLLVVTAIYSLHKRHQRDLRNILLTTSQQMVSNRDKSVLMGEPSASITTNGEYINNLLTQDPKTSVPLADCEAQTLMERVESLVLNKTRTAILPQTNGDSSYRQSVDISHLSSASSISNWLTFSPKTIKILKALSIRENFRDFQEPPILLRASGACKKVRINLNSLDSIKCLCCVLVIFGHIIFVHMQHLSNVMRTIEVSYWIYPRMLIAFFNFVDTFFIISGMLTAYFVFKRFNKRNFGNPLIWFYISMLRLLRLSPVYLLVLWFIKTVVVHLSAGPIWDYGTDDNSIAGLCINDSWWKSILYLGNYGTMQPLCILPAWSIIVDSQYSLILPPILFLILKHKRIGYASLLAAIFVSTINMSYQLATQTAVKTSDMSKVRLHVYPLISRFAAEFYNTPWNRIGSVAVGVMGGHMLYLYDIGRIRRWPWFMRGISFKFILLMHFLIFILPTASRFTDDPESREETDITIFVLTNATIKPIWSLINTILLLRLVTDLRRTSILARIMAHNAWHCLGKLCFVSYLIHYEIIIIFLKSKDEGLLEPTWSNIIREFCLVFMISTLVSYFVYILYEAPVNKLIMMILAKPDYGKIESVELVKPGEHVNSTVIKSQICDQEFLDGKRLKQVP